MSDYTEMLNRLKSAADCVETALEEYLSDDLLGNTDVSEAMRYSTLGGGKRIRAFLALEFARLFGADEEKAMPFAASLECVHAYSLIHDDLPCMDNDTMRRGKPTNHIKFGEPVALLAGDGLLTHAFAIAASNREVSPESCRLMIHTLATEAGAYGMVGGQTLDIEGTVASYGALCEIYDKKTGALLRAACLAGYYAATDKPDDAVVADIRAYADSIGLAFQIHDDILDVKSDAETLGKDIGSDQKNDKKTSLAFFALEEAEAEERRLTEYAVERISAYPGSETLSDLARWLILRNK